MEKINKNLEIETADSILLTKSLESNLTNNVSTSEHQIYFDDYLYCENINNNNNLLLVKNTKTKNFYIQKILTQYDKTIYDYIAAHPVKNIPKIINMKIIDGNLVILKEFIEGNTLTNYLNKTKNLDTKFFYQLAYDICDTLIILHSIKTPIIHRDIKPDNVIVSTNGKVYLIDFNSAKFYNSNQKRDTVLLGTEGYAAPEQYGFGASSPLADVYAFGVLLDKILPFFNDKILSKKMKPIIEKCCKLDPIDRYKNMKLLKRDIENKENNLFFWLIPGFRNADIFHILIATFFYIQLFNYCFLENSKSYNFSKINISIFITIIAFIFTFFNYLNIHKFMPLTKSKNLLLKFLGTIILSLTIAFFVSLICTIFCII